MQVEELTPNGIDKLFDGEPVILQVIDFKLVGKQQEQQKFILAELSDGYASIPRCFFTSYHFPDLKPLFKVVRVKLTEPSVDKKQKLIQNKGKKNTILSIDRSEDIYHIIYSHLNKKIGEPLDYRTYVNKNSCNNKGNRTIPLPKNSVKKKKEIIEEDSQEQLTSAIEQLRKVSKKHEQKRQSSASMKSNQNSNVQTSIIIPKNKNNKPNRPIQVLPQERRSSIKPEISNFSDQHTKIRELFLGIENFSLCVRVLFVFPVKSFLSKKGNQSQLLNIQLGDSSGVIMCTIFGESIPKFSNICHDEIYIIQGASVSESSFKGIKQLKLGFNQKITTLKRVTQKQAKIPEISHFGISVKQLTEMEKGRIYTVTAYVKQNPKVEFVSKKGKDTVKKVLRLFDLENHIEAEVLIWNEYAEIDYPEGMYIIRGIQIQQFMGQKQFRSNFNIIIRKIPNSKIKKNIENIEQMGFTNVSSNQKVKKQTITSFLQLQEKCQELADKQSAWSEVVCYLKAVKYGGNSKTTYVSCPFCRKKVDETDRECYKCSKKFDAPQHRYILSINLVDDYSSIWANSYDDTGPFILAEGDQEKFEAEQFLALGQEALRMRINNIRYKRMKLKIVSNYEEYNGQRRLKHKVLKILTLSPSEQCKKMLQKIHTILEAM